MIEGNTVPQEKTAMDIQVAGTHYKGMKIQHFTFCQVNELGWGESSAIKYICRHQNKNKAEDIDKAIHYLLMVRDHYYPDAPKKFGSV